MPLLFRYTCIEFYNGNARFYATARGTAFLLVFVCTVLTLFTFTFLPRDASAERGYEIACRSSVRDDQVS